MPIALIKFAKANGIECDETTDAKTLSDAMQKAWFQKDKLRYQITGNTADEKAPPSGENLSLLREMGFIDEVLPPPPSGNRRKVVFILGALLSRVNDRLAWYKKVVGEGKISAEAELYCLGSARPLDFMKESPSELWKLHPDLPVKDSWVTPERMFPQKLKTEADMMDLVALRAGFWNAIIVDTPMQPKEGGGTRPANTGDTVKEWIRLHGSKDMLDCNITIVSNNPFVNYQTLSVKRAITEASNCICSVSGTGPAANMLPLATFRDNVAKQVYEELQDLALERKANAQAREYMLDNMI